MAGSGGPELGTLLLRAESRLDAVAADREDAVRKAGAALLAGGAVAEGYTEAMLSRERSVSTFLGEGVAVPHGTLADRGLVRRDALVVLRLPAGVDWGGPRVDLVIGLAARGAGQIALLSRLATVLLDPGRLTALRVAPDAAAVAELLAEAPSAD